MKKQNVSELKLSMQKLEKISAHLQQLSYLTKKLDDGLDILILCLNEGMLNPDISLNLVGNQSKHISCNFPNSSYNIEILKDSTISLLKDKICDASGVLKVMMKISFGSMIWRIGRPSMFTKVIQVMIKKK